VERAAAQAKIDQQLAEMKVFPLHLIFADITLNPFCFVCGRPGTTKTSLIWRLECTSRFFITAFLF
jgi:hypothetical protein